ncbi:hypothetical protein DFH28DRAFT_1098110 [Melampsora americana]|nr:hypothetical protein DFH28DRAFT_1098110 [Melampsora americana]
MNRPEFDCHKYLSEVGGSFSAVDGRLGPGDFHTVCEVEENGWSLPPRGPVSLPQVSPNPIPPAQRLDGLVSTGLTARRNLKRPAPNGAVAQPSAKQVATSFESTLDSAISTPNLIKITNVEQCPDFWAMPVHALYEWRQSVVILDRTILGYYQQALKDTEEDLERATSADAACQRSNGNGSGLPPPPELGQRRAICAIQGVKEETPGPPGSTTPAFKFNSDGPNRLDLIYMRALEALSPFGAKGQKGKVFHECAIWLKNDTGTRQHFSNLSDSPNSRVLQVRYTQLKTWLAAAEGWSRMASGTEEDDEELRQLIRLVQDEEETGRALRLAGQEEREAVKGRSLLAEAVREQYADKAIQDYKASGADSEKDTQLSSTSRKGKRAVSSSAKTSTDELAAFTGELGRWNDVSLAAQAEQNTRINKLYERELVIARERNKNERLMSQLLAKHRAAELALQKQRLEFDKAQVNILKNPLDTLEAKINAIEMNTSTKKFDALEAKMGSMNEALLVMMQHIVGLAPSTSNP